MIWGTTYLGIRVALEAVPPALMGAFRWIIAGTLLVVYVRLRGQALPHVAQLAQPGAPGAADDRLRQRLRELGRAVGAERPRRGGDRDSRRSSWPASKRSTPTASASRAGRFVGLVLGFIGILVLVWPDLQFDDAQGAQFVLGLLALQVACLGWAIGSSYSKRHPHGESVIGATAVQMIFGGLIMLVVGTLGGEWGRVSLHGRGVAALAYLTVAGSIGGFVSYIYALQYLPVSTVSIYAYINPLIAVILGALLLGEPFSARTVVVDGHRLRRRRAGEAAGDEAVAPFARARLAEPA